MANMMLHKDYKYHKDVIQFLVCSWRWVRNVLIMSSERMKQVSVSFFALMP